MSWFAGLPNDLVTLSSDIAKFESNIDDFLINMSDPLRIIESRSVLDSGMISGSNSALDSGMISVSNLVFTFILRKS